MHTRAMANQKGGVGKTTTAVSLAGLLSRRGERVLLVPTPYDRRTRASRDSLQRPRDHHEPHLWQGIFPVDTRLRDASRAGRPLRVVDPGARGAIAYATLLAHLLDDHAAGSAPMLPPAGQSVADAGRRA